MRLAGSLFRKLVYTIAGPENRDLVTLSFHWERILGKLLAEKAVVLRIENNVLFVGVSNNVWMQELVLMKRKILFDIKRTCGLKLKNIIFTINS